MQFILATSRPWNEAVAAELEEKTGYPFLLINREKDLTLEILREINPRYIFFPHWSYIIPKEIYTSYECIIFHMTDLPYGRGGSPLQNLIVRGHTETQISALRCVAEVDAGPIYLKRTLSLKGAASDIFSRASLVIGGMIEQIIYEEPEPQAQQGKVVLFQRRTPDESDLSKAELTTLDGLFDFIRMLDADGYPRAFIEMGVFRLELSDARATGDSIKAQVTIAKKEE